MSTGLEGDERNEEMAPMSILSMPEILPPALGGEVEGTALPGAMGREAVCTHAETRLAISLSRSNTVWKTCAIHVVRIIEN